MRKTGRSNLTLLEIELYSDFNKSAWTEGSLPHSFNNKDGRNSAGNTCSTTVNFPRITVKIWCYTGRFSKLERRHQVFSEKKKQISRSFRVIQIIMMKLNSRWLIIMWLLMCCLRASLDHFGILVVRKLEVCGARVSSLIVVSPLVIYRDADRTEICYGRCRPPSAVDRLVRCQWLWWDMMINIKSRK